MERSDARDTPGASCAAVGALLGEAARVRLGAHQETPAGVLAALAEDSAITVRAAVAMNRAAPSPINCLLAHDPDERVRSLLARKAAQLAPIGDGLDAASLHGRIALALTILVGDEVVRVRAAISDIVKSMPDAPREVILRLAHDADFDVSNPIIRFSPLLTAADLLALLAAPQHSEVARTMACRADLPAEVADAIAATADTAAVRLLLCNPTAAVREATLDALVVEATGRPEWHEPLARHPALSAQSAGILARIVAEEVLAVLAARTDLDPGILRHIERRLVQTVAPAAAPPRMPPPPHKGLTYTVMETARRLDCSGGLDEAAMLTAAEHGDEALLASMLAVAAGLPLAVVEHAVALRSAKGIVSLVWRAGFTMRVAEPLQAALAGLGPAQILTASQNGAFPLTEDEMRFQLRVLSRVSPESACRSPPR